MRTLLLCVRCCRCYRDAINTTRPVHCPGESKSASGRTAVPRMTNVDECTTLARKHPVWSDGGALRFYTEGHRYTLHDVNVRKSVTGVLKDVFDSGFDGEAVVKRYLNDWKNDVSHPNHKLVRYLMGPCGMTPTQAKQEFLKLWDFERDTACDAGTAMHLTLERFLNDELPPPVSIKEKPDHAVVAYLGMREWFYPDMGLRPWRTELRVVYTVPYEGNSMDPVAVFCGSIDAVFIDKNNRMWIFDWKSTDAQKKGLLGKRKADSHVPKKAKAPFEAYDVDDYHKYSAQLLLYKWCMEHDAHEPREVAGCFLVQINEKMDRAHVVEAAEMDDAVARMVDIETAAALAERRALVEA